MLPGQRVALQLGEVLARHAVDLLVERLRELRHEPPHQQRDVVDALAQRRHVDREDVQAIEQVLAKAAVGNPQLQVAMGRGDDAGVEMNRLRAAEPLELPLFEHAQQLDLDLRRQLADFIEEDRRLIGQLEAADLARDARR